jgi:hypothetical protein
MLYTETKETLDIQCVLFYRRIKSCRVLVVKEEKIDEWEAAVENVDSKTVENVNSKTVENVESKIVEQPGPVELECGDESDHESISTVSVPSKVRLNPETVEPQNLSRNKRSKKIQREKNGKNRPQKDTKFMLKRLQLQDCNENELEAVDKFTAIKQRRSHSISMVATPPQAKKQKTLPSLTLDSQSSGISTSSETKQDYNQNEIDKFTAIKRRGSRGVSTAPILKEQKKKKNETKLKIKKEPKAKEPEVVVSEALNSTVELQPEDEQETMNNTQEVMIVLPEDDPMVGAPEPSDNAFEPLGLQASQSFDVDSFESFSENLLRDTPQLKNIASKTVTPPSVPVSIPINISMEAVSAVVCTESSSQISSESSPNKILLYEDYKKLYNLRDCQISCNQLDPKKLDKILAKRNFTSQKVTKSGRIAKPSVVYDPSPEPRKIKSIKARKLEKKIKLEAMANKSQVLVFDEDNEVPKPDDGEEVPKTNEVKTPRKSVEKSRKSEEKKVKSESKLQKSQEKPRKSSEMKIRLPKCKVLKSKQSPFITDKVEEPAGSVELEYPEEFPESIEIEEDYVEYATSLEGE